MHVASSSNLAGFDLTAHTPYTECSEHGRLHSHAYLNRDTAFCTHCGVQLIVHSGEPFGDAEQIQAAEDELLRQLTDGPHAYRWRSLVASWLDNHIGLHGLESVWGDRGDELLGAPANETQTLWPLLFRAGWTRLGSGKGNGPQWHPNARAQKMCTGIGIYGLHNQRPAGAPYF